MFWVVDDHLPERARVDEQEVGIAEVEDDVGVQGSLGAAVDEEHLARHAQVDHQRVARVEWTQEVLAAAPGGREGGAGEPVDQRLARRAPDRPLAADLDPLDSSSDDEPLETSPDGLDLRELGHFTAFPGHAGRSWPLLGWRLVARTPASSR